MKSIAKTAMSSAMFLSLLLVGGCSWTRRPIVEAMDEVVSIPGTNRIYFGPVKSPNAYLLDEKDKEVLDEFVDAQKSNPSMVITVTAHASRDHEFTSKDRDELDRISNASVASKRAELVKRYLESKGAKCVVITLHDPRIGDPENPNPANRCVMLELVLETSVFAHRHHHHHHKAAHGGAHGAVTTLKEKLTAAPVVGTIATKAVKKVADKVTDKVGPASADVLDAHEHEDE